MSYEYHRAPTSLPVAMLSSAVLFFRGNGGEHKNHFFFQVEGCRRNSSRLARLCNKYCSYGPGIFGLFRASGFGIFCPGFGSGFGPHLLSKRELFSCKYCS